jgi:hypothetical protein
MFKDDQKINFNFLALFFILKTFIYVKEKNCFFPAFLMQEKAKEKQNRVLRPALTRIARHAHIRLRQDSF